MNRDFNSNEFDREIVQLSEKSAKRLILIITILGLLPLPILFFISQNQTGLFVIGWFIWILSSILLSPKIAMKIWKN